jgi:Cd2+/Zn2+-exporting ATPase
MIGHGAEGPAMTDTHLPADTAATSVAATTGTPAHADEPHRPDREAFATAVCLIGGLLGWVSAAAAPTVPPTVSVAAFGVAAVAGGVGPLIEALSALVRGRLTVDLLMVMAASGAAFIGSYGEAVVLLFLFSLSNALEHYAMYRTHRSVAKLMGLRPDTATVVRDGVETRVPVGQLRIGDLVRVRPGERFPVDGAVEEGDTDADEATLTGESVPVPKTVGSPVFAGTINGAGSIAVRTGKAPGDTMLERIVQVVRAAQAEKTPAQRFVESWQQPYVLGVMALTALTFAANYWGMARAAEPAFYQAMVMLVAASPCAVVISAPAVMLSAIAAAARGGVLIKGAGHLETLGRVRIIAFDKTGTLTIGKPAVTQVWVPEGGDPDGLLALAAAVERRSEHPLARAVAAEADRRRLSAPEPERFENHVGAGVHGVVAGTWVGVGRDELFAAHDIAVPEAVSQAAARLRAEGAAALLAGTGDGGFAVIALVDRVRPEAAGTLADLRRLGVADTVILTGDHARVAETVAAAVGAARVKADLLPADKVAALRALAAEGPVAMVGDGVNDAPALAAADIGIAMGKGGSDVALETADVVLMGDDLTALPFAVQVGRTARRRVIQNLVFAGSAIAVLITGTLVGLPLWLAVIGHEGGTLLVVANGLRMLLMRR